MKNRPNEESRPAKKRFIATVAWMLAGTTLGVGATFLFRELHPTQNEHVLGRKQLVDYCRIFAHDGSLLGGAGGALSWRCVDLSDPAFRKTVGLVNLAGYCRDRYGKTWSATIRNLRRNDGWSCTTPTLTSKEFTVNMNVDSQYPAIGTRVANGSVVAVVDSPNRYLDAEAEINFRKPITVKVFCVHTIIDPEGPPQMFGVIAPLGQRGFVRSDFTNHPTDKLGLPPCS